MSFPVLCALCEADQALPGEDLCAECLADHAPPAAAELAVQAQRVAELEATVARLNTTLQAYGDGGNEGPSICGFIEEDPNLLRLLKTKQARVADLEREVERLTSSRTEDNPCAQALDDLWKATILARNPSYGDWEYPAQAYRHLLIEFREAVQAARAEEREACADHVRSVGLRFSWASPGDYRLGWESGCDVAQDELRRAPAPSAPLRSAPADEQKGKPVEMDTMDHGTPFDEQTGPDLVADGTARGVASPAPPAASEQDVFGDLAREFWSIKSSNKQWTKDCAAQLRARFGECVEALEFYAADLSYGIAARVALASLRERKGSS